METECLVVVVCPPQWMACYCDCYCCDVMMTTMRLMKRTGRLSFGIVGGTVFCSRQGKEEKGKEEKGKEEKVLI